MLTRATVITPSVSTADDFSIGSYDQEFIHNDLHQLMDHLNTISFMGNIFQEQEESSLKSTSQGGGMVSTQEPSSISPFPISNVVIGNGFYCEDKAALASNSHSIDAQDFLDLLSTLDDALDNNNDVNMP